MEKKALGRKGFGMKSEKPLGMGIGKGSKKIKQRNKEIKMKIEQSRDKTRAKLLETRKDLKEKERKNELKTERRRKEHELNNNPTVVALKPSREWAKLIRNPANWSSVPAKPKLSRAYTHRKRIYGKRFEWMEIK